MDAGADPHPKSVSGRKNKRGGCLWPIRPFQRLSSGACLFWFYVFFVFVPSLIIRILQDQERSGRSGDPALPSEASHQGSHDAEVSTTESPSCSFSFLQEPSTRSPSPRTPLPLALGLVEAGNHRDRQCSEECVGIVEETMFFDIPASTVNNKGACARHNAHKESNATPTQGAAELSCVFLRKLGHGTQGQVWEGRVRGTFKPIVVKTMHKKHVEDAHSTNIMARKTSQLFCWAFQNEITLLQACKGHPHVIQILGWTPDLSQFMMEKAHIDLHKRLVYDQNGMCLAQRECYFGQILRGVAFLHSLDITHTDIKPENLLIGEGDRIQICDLGMGQRGAKPNSHSRWSVVGEIGTLW